MEATLRGKICEIAMRVVVCLRESCDVSAAYKVGNERRVADRWESHAASIVLSSATRSVEPNSRGNGINAVLDYYLCIVTRFWSCSRLISTFDAPSVCPSADV